ncbi:MAG: universal stress protein [Pseudomonadota bacterium]
MKTRKRVQYCPLPHDRPLTGSESGTVCKLLDRILVVVDPAAAAHPCIDKAMHMAPTGSTVELYARDAELNLSESWAGESRVAEYKEIQRQRQLQELERLAAPLRLAGLRVETTCERGRPLEDGIRQHIIRTRPDLVIAQCPVGGVALQLLQQIDCELLVMNPC